MSPLSPFKCFSFCVYLLSRMLSFFWIMFFLRICIWNNIFLFYFVCLGVITIMTFFGQHKVHKTDKILYCTFAEHRVSSPPLCSLCSPDGFQLNKIALIELPDLIELSWLNSASQTINPVETWRGVVPESIKGFIEASFSCSLMIRLLAHPYPPPHCQHVVYLSQSSCVSLVELADGRGGGG